MAITDPADGLECTAYYCTNEYADENTNGAVWTVLGYVTGLKFTKNRNERDVYNKRNKVCTKLGRNEFTGNISALYTQGTVGISKIFTDALPIALKLEIDKGLTGTPTETRYYSNVAVKNYNEDFGNINDGGDVTVSCDFSFEDDHAV